MKDDFADKVPLYCNAPPHHPKKDCIDKLPQKWAPPHKLFQLALIFFCFFAVVFVVRIIAIEHTQDKYESPENFDVESIVESTTLEGNRYVTITLDHRYNRKIIKNITTIEDNDKQLHFVIDGSNYDNGKNVYITYPLGDESFTVTICGEGDPICIYTYTPDSQE